MDGPRRFADRTDAGQRLATELRDRGIDADVVLAIPRGGLPLGRAVADALDAPLDVVVGKKIGAPGDPEYAIGAVASDGAVWRNEPAIRNLGVDDAAFRRRRGEAMAAARRTVERYRGDRPGRDLAGDSVVLVDDGVATGATLRACLQSIRDRDPGRVVLAVPVGPPGTIRELEGLADEVVCLVAPEVFGAVGQFYDRFGQVSDREPLSYLDRTP